MVFISMNSLKLQPKFWLMLKYLIDAEKLKYSLKVVFWMSDFKNGNNNANKYNILGLLDVKC